MVLAGDACHAMAPFLGQGANQGIQDAVCLAQRLALVGAGAGGYATVKEALEAYEQTRKPQTSNVAARRSPLLSWCRLLAGGSITSAHNRAARSAATPRGAGIE